MDGHLIAVFLTNMERKSVGLGESNISPIYKVVNYRLNSTPELVFLFTLGLYVFKDHTTSPCEVKNLL